MDVVLSYRIARTAHDRQPAKILINTFYDFGLENDRAHLWERLQISSRLVERGMKCCRTSKGFQFDQILPAYNGLSMLLKDEIDP